MGIFTRKKNLPKPRGPYSTSCVDLMTEFSQEGIFVRLHYPATPLKDEEESERWIPWAPHEKYVQGIAFVVGLWVFVIQLVMWWYGGFIHIPIMYEAKLLPKSQRGNKKLPVVLFSHGFGACRFLCSTTLNELASQGYLVASVEHRDTSACATYYYKSADDRDQDKRTWITHKRLQLGAKHYAIRNKQLKYRRDECVKVLDFLEEINSGNISKNILKTSLNLKDFEGQLDLDQVTVMGHSFGGATSLLTLSCDSRFKQGVILDGWMFPLKEEGLEVPQPLIFINSSTFHIPSNLAVMIKFVKNPAGQLYEIKTSTHETQTDSPHVFGYWLDLFKPKIDPSLGILINNYLIVKFLQAHTGTPVGIEHIDKELEEHSHLIVRGQTPKPVTAHVPFKLT